MSYLKRIREIVNNARNGNHPNVTVPKKDLFLLLHDYERMDAISRREYEQAEAARLLSANRSKGVHWLIKTSDDTEHYVSRIDNIQFSPGIENAKELTLAELANTLGQLAIMQRQSSWKPSDYTMICVKE